MGVPPMKHGQDARATPAGKEFFKSFKGVARGRRTKQDSHKGAWLL